jgi:AraC family transcriptional regulator, regulatory protein of adaptative response / methylated-DNA-[protein]-cysteine methyltransferase
LALNEKGAKTILLETDKSEGTAADPRWAAVVARDARADGAFSYAVASTGVYCRPSCPARLARPENVTFHATPEAAERAGFRACKRCKPDELPLRERQAARVAELCRFIDTCLERGEEPPGLQALSEHAGISPHHLHRLFKSVSGVTPRAYAAAQRARRLRLELESESSVTAALYRAGFSSSGGLYSTSNQRLGMTPSRYRAGGAEEEITFAVGSCSLGAILVAATARGICSILLGQDAGELTLELRRRFPRASVRSGGAAFEQQLAQVVAFVEAPQLGSSLPLDVRGTAFQERVWQALQAIPAGETRSYAQVAHALGAPRAVRAVASACAANPLAVAVPCHRVVRSDGALSGYRWGVERKRALLAREGAHAAGVVSTVRSKVRGAP